MTHPGHNNPWRAGTDWGYKVKYDTDRQLHESRQRSAALARECARRDAALQSSRSAGSSSSPSFDFSSTYSGGAGGSDDSGPGIVWLIIFAGVGLLILNDFVPLVEYFWRAVNLVIFVGSMVATYMAGSWILRLFRR